MRCTVDCYEEAESVGCNCNDLSSSLQAPGLYEKFTDVGSVSHQLMRGSVSHQYKRGTSHMKGAPSSATQKRVLLLLCLCNSRLHHSPETQLCKK